MHIEQTIAELERVAAREVGRGSEALAEPAKGGLLAAARSLATATAPDAAVFTGFFIPGADPPAAETDGPLGAVQIAAALRLLGDAAGSSPTNPAPRWSRRPSPPPYRAYRWTSRRYPATRGGPPPSCPATVS
ncbi:glutamate cyclase domain-containing protein [Micromonospora tarensis]|uniref:glutamate cyclase domain-containing protein n=1 Tax=Micromonospora tarensis TaxID=2806100 RepID=UPI0028155068|nr:glutamate cyclase domain-containing protein [Micromonospora tarensis]